ncbi:hypothetical protein AVEN_206286-1 [Araneus ventricosus]|uniref:Uncharacterized protein n=1 Tax=Araneus ventricosus TaxID=182803 RepID=A0A4Y2V037_ARAVE|nr:hypothetical protein AVEN_112799-1 [Araneus ventricosus]GBO18545.1 hypothetical protein AVEN_206286-1 [Araneus ventricosus]
MLHFWLLTLRTAFPMMQNAEIAKDLTPLSLDPDLSGPWKKILTTKIRKNTSFAEARRLVSERSPKPGITYSSALKKCAYCGAHTNPENAKNKFCSFNHANHTCAFF